ncbi:MAG: type II secretion system protein GspG [Dehalococcoidia bacterium]
MKLDLRAVLPIAALTIVVLVIIFAQICGSEDVVAPEVVSTPPETPTAEEPGETATPGPSPTEEPGAPTATEEPGGGEEERDVARQEDLTRLAFGLEAYRQENDAYPTTDGNVQSLCVFPGDAACELEEIIGDLPNDPLGEPASENGYWYASDGDTYTVWAQRETDTVPECPDHPSHLEGVDSLQCAQGSASPPPT